MANRQVGTEMARARGIRRYGLGALSFFLLWHSVLLMGGLRHIRAAGPWQPPVRLSRSSGESGHPTLAVTDQGLVHVVWQEQGYLWHTWSQGGLWQAPQQGVMGSEPDLAAAGDALHLVYVSTHAGRQQVYYQSGRASALSPPRPVSSPTADCAQPRLAVSAAGRVAIAWVRNAPATAPTPSPPILYYTIAEESLPFTELPLLLGDTAARGHHPVLGVDGTGALRAAWEEPQGDILHAWQAGGGWVGAFYVSDTPAVPSTMPDLVVDPAGVAHLVWQEGARGASEVHYVAWSGGPSEQQRISSGERAARAPRLALDRQGGVHAAWDEATTLRYRHLGPSGGWGAIETVASGLSIEHADVAVDPQGTVHVVWAQREPTGVLEVYYSQRRAEPAPPSPTAEPPTPTLTPTALPPTATPLATSPTAQPVPTLVPPSATAQPSPYPGRETPTPRPTEAPATTATLAPSAAPSQEPSPTPAASFARWSYLPRVERLWSQEVVRGQVTAEPPIRVLAQAAASPTPTPPPAPPVRLSDAGASARGPAIAVSPAGAVHVVWEQGEELYHAYRQGDGWTEPVRVASGESPALAAAGDGSLHLAFVNEFGGNFEIYHVRWNGTSWSLPHNVSRTTSGVSSLPDIAVASDGSVHIVWTDTSPGYAVIYHARGYPGPFDTLPVPNARGSAPALALTSDPSGQVAVHVVWQDRDTPDAPLEVYYTVREQGLWALAQNISASPAADSRSPDLAVEGAELRLVWQEDNTSRTVCTVRGRSGWWPLAVRVSPVTEAAYLPAVDSDGSITHVAWDTGRAIKLAQTWSWSSTWPQPQVLVDGVDEATDVAVAAGPGRQAHLAWAQRQGERWAVYYASRAFRAPYSYYLPLTMR